jgi:hypothetical protein
MFGIYNLQKAITKSIIIMRRKSPTGILDSVSNHLTRHSHLAVAEFRGSAASSAGGGAASGISSTGGGAGRDIKSRDALSPREAKMISNLLQAGEQLARGQIPAHYTDYSDAFERFAHCICALELEDSLAALATLNALELLNLIVQESIQPTALLRPYLIHSLKTLYPDEFALLAKPGGALEIHASLNNLDKINLRLIERNIRPIPSSSLIGQAIQTSSHTYNQLQAMLNYLKHAEADGGHAKGIAEVTSSLQILCWNRLEQAKSQPIPGAGDVTAGAHMVSRLFHSALGSSSSRLRSRYLNIVEQLAKRKPRSSDKSGGRACAADEKEEPPTSPLRAIGITKPRKAVGDDTSSPEIEMQAYTQAPPAGQTPPAGPKN